MKNYLILISCLLASPFVQADQIKNINCVVETYVGGKAFGMGWLSPRITVPTISLSAKSFQGHDEGSTSGTVAINNGYELVFDLHWQSGVLANDDLTNIAGASMSLQTRLQKKAADGSTLIVGWSNGASSKSLQKAKPADLFFVTDQVRDVQAYSTALSKSVDSDMSNDSLQRAADGVSKTLIYQLSCSTTSSL